MQTSTNEEEAQIYGLFPVEFQFQNGYASCWSQSNDVRKILTPGEMLSPSLRPWIEQRCLCARLWIGCRGLIVFLTIASRTGIGQILE